MFIFDAMETQEVLCGVIGTLKSLKVFKLTSEVVETTWENLG